MWPGGEKVWSYRPPSRLSPGLALSLPQPAEKAIGAEQTNHMAIKHYSPPLHWDFIQTAFTGLCSVLIPASKRRTQARKRTHAHTDEPPHQHDSSFTSPHSVRSLIPRVALEQHQQYMRREKGGTEDNSAIEPLRRAGRVVDKAHKKRSWKS